MATRSTLRSTAIDLGAARLRRMAGSAVSPELPQTGAEPVVPLEPNLQPFRDHLCSWFRKHARDLPWRGIHSAYGTWLSEIMLQQTRVATVIDRYGEFLRKFPTLHDLANADESDVLALWSGLGYYRRARMLHKAARFVITEREGKLPRSSRELRSLPGIGDYTAAAIASIAFGESVAVVDGNVERVLLRLLGKAEDGTAATRRLIGETAAMLVPPKPVGRTRTNPPGTHNQAMMELGATICVPRQPLCLQCPVVAFCHTRGEHLTPARQPQKSRVVAHLLALRKSGTSTEVLLERRPEESRLMPRMLELPPLPLEAVEGREPALRLRHSITNTNYYVQIYTEGEAGVPLEQLRKQHRLAQQDTLFDESSSDEPFTDEELFTSEPLPEPGKHELLQAVPMNEADLRWMHIAKLGSLPLTGLARKVLQRLGVMLLPKVTTRK